MQQDNTNIDLKLPTGWEDLDNPLTFGKKKKHFSFCSHSIADLTDKQLRYVFALLSQGFTATEVKAYCLCRWAGLKILHRYGNSGWACRHNRKRRRWFSRKYYASVMRLKEFYEDNVGRSFTGILSDFARRKK